MLQLRRPPPPKELKSSRVFTDTLCVWPALFSSWAVRILVHRETSKTLKTPSCFVVWPIPLVLLAVLHRAHELQQKITMALFCILGRFFNA